MSKFLCRYVKKKVFYTVIVQSNKSGFFLMKLEKEHITSKENRSK